MRLNCQRVIRFVGLLVLIALLLLPSLALAEVDITDKVEIIKGRMTSDRRTGDALIDVSIRNISQDVILTPIKIVITSVSSTAVTVADFDGVTSEGQPYYEYALPTGQLLTTETISAKRWRFVNPTRVRFSYTTQILGSFPDKAEVIDSSGGIIETDTGVVLEIPSASLMEAQVMSVTKIPEETLELADAIDNAYLVGAADFKPDGQQFDWPVKITIPLKETRDPGTILPLYIFNDELGNYKNSGFTCEVAADGFSCTGEVTHFCTYATGSPSATPYIWQFGDHPYFDSDNEYRGEFAYFIPKASGEQNKYGPRLPNFKRSGPSGSYMVGWGQFVSVVESQKDIATRLYGSLCDENTQDQCSIDSTKEPVVFIHGYQAFNKFGGGEKYWGDFPELINALDLEGRKFAAFDFQWRTNARFQDVADDFYDAIDAIYTRMGNKKVHIVAHSFGGIVTRVMLQNYFSDGNDRDVSSRVASVTTIGTPHSGIADNYDKLMHGMLFPKGQNSSAHEFAGQISSHQMGEDMFEMFPDEDFCRDLDIYCSEGRIAQLINTFDDDEHKLPENLPFQVAIGLRAIPNPEADTSTLLNGDDLISYEGQRFHPSLTVYGHSYTDYESLLKGQTEFNHMYGEFGAYVKETLLGLGEEDIRPSGQIPAQYQNFVYGYTHSRTTAKINFQDYIESVVDCDPEDICEHASFQVVKDWLTQYSSDCDSSNLGLCTTSSTCDSAGGYWWSDNTCNSTSDTSTVLLSDDFESYSLETWPSSWVPDANALNSANNKIVQDPQDPSNQVLKIYGSVGGCWAALTYHPIVFPEDFYVELRVYNGSESLSGCHPYRAQFEMRHGTHWYSVTNPAYSFMLFFRDDQIVGHTRSDILANYQTNRWYDVKVHHERTGDQVTLTYWIDGVYLGQTTDSVDLDKHLTMDHLELVSQEGSVYFDNIKVYTGGTVSGGGGGGTM